MKQSTTDCQKSVCMGMCVWVFLVSVKEKTEMEGSTEQEKRKTVTAEVERKIKWGRDTTEENCNSTA